MKSVLSLILLMFSLFINAQYQIDAELLTSNNTGQTPKIKNISCRGSIIDNSPLFIIDGIPLNSSENQSYLEFISPDDIISISILKDVPAIFCDGDAKNGVVLITTNAGKSVPVKTQKKYPFKVYDICKTDLITSQDMYNAIQANVPSIRINSSSMVSALEVRMRGNDNTIVLVDGIRYDTSVLSTLNPSDIESVSVAPSAAATNYFLTY